jgi:mediator of RNA polymerase II transcription subunit 5
MADSHLDLLEPFLPSLIAGLTYFAHKIWETTEQSTNLDIFLPALTTLVKPRSISSDSAAMHSAVLSIVAKPLEHALQHAQRRHPRRADILPLLEALKLHAHKMRGDTTAFAELETWSATPGGSLPASLRHTFQSLILWASPSSTELCPPHYTHRQLILSVQVLGAKTVLSNLIDELMLHVTSPNSLDAALDVIVTMISAPQARFPDAIATTDLNSALPLRRQISLRDALKMLFDEADEISKKDVNRASVIVRLQRRVDALIGRGHDAGEGVEGGLVAGVGMSGLGTAVELETEGIMGNETVKNADGLPTVDIDDVLEQATEDAQMSAAGFMTGGDMGQNDFMTLG